MAKTLILLTTFLLIMTLTQSKHDPVIAPGPTPPPLNITAILEKGGQYTTLIRLLNSTQVLSQLQNQLNNSFNGLTILAPTDNAFSNLAPGTLNSLGSQEQVALILYHVLPRYYSLSTFETASNPVSTQASGSNGVYTVNVTSSSRQVNVSTGVNEAEIENELYQDFPLAVYSVEDVLLPYDIFGAKPPAEAPAPTEGRKKEKIKKKIPAAKGPAAAAANSADDMSNTTTTSAGGSGLKMKRVMDWGFGVGVGVVLWICVGYVL